MEILKPETFDIKKIIEATKADFQRLENSAMEWDIDSAYSGLESPEYVRDEMKISQLTEKLQLITKELFPNGDACIESQTPQIHSLQQALELQEEIEILLFNLSTYAQCASSVDGSRIDFKTKISCLQTTHSNLQQIMMPIDLFVQNCSEPLFKEILNTPRLLAYTFFWTEKRLKRQELLSTDQEVLLKAMANPGLTGWGNLYDALSSTMRVPLKTETGTDQIGLSQAHALIRSADEKSRKSAWLAIQEGWTLHQETSAAILNGIAGWRIEVAKKRSSKKSVHYLDSSLFSNRISNETLQAMLQSCLGARQKIQKLGPIMAKLLGKTALDPWDLLAPSPIAASDNLRTYGQAMTMIRESFAQVDASMADFCNLAVQNKWIEGRISPNKKTGAYCTFFSKSREPRVFMSFMGSNNDVLTLAHELGHAYHSWVMRDLPIVQQDYPSTLAETASIFAEAALGDVMLEQATSHEEKMEFAWTEAERAMAFLLNIPMRFVFEKNFYDRRESQFVPASELCSIMDQAWQKWYGNCFRSSDSLFWAHKLHFSMSENSFYNYPYTFGYLFSLSLFARKQEYGAGFISKYIAILRDTGRMTAEDLIQKHLGENIQTVAFWQKAIDISVSKVEYFANLCGSLDKQSGLRL